MRRFNYFCSFLLTITMPLMIVILSTNLILRTSAVYNYHFNDSEVMNEIYYSIEGSEMASDISSYWSSFSSDKFQVYEINGEYKDPVFKSNEQQIMKKMKNILNIELLFGLLFTVVSLSIYIYFVKHKYVEALRNRFLLGSGFTLALGIAYIVCFSIKGFRKWLYSSLIGIKLEKTSTLSIILGDPFYKTYLLFSVIVVVAFWGVLAYINHKYTKPARIFY